MFHTEGLGSFQLHTGAPHLHLAQQATTDRAEPPAFMGSGQLTVGKTIVPPRQVALGAGRGGPLSTCLVLF